MVYDIILRNGIIVDGSGAPPFRGDIGIVGDTIAHVGDLSGEKASETIDIKGLYVAPGFIDIHNHSDMTIFEVPTADNYVMQGVTTIVNGNCGLSSAPLTENNKELVIRLSRWMENPERISINWRSFEDYMKAVEALGSSVNVVQLVGHGAVRSAVMGFEDRVPKPSEIEEMKCLVEEAMKAGAFGFSTGLVYVPSMYASAEEIIELVKVISKYGGVYATHMRSEGLELVDSVIESITVGLKAGVAVEISHLKASGRPSWGKVKVALSIIEDYANRGFDVSADVYPYTAGSTTLSTLFPPWARDTQSLKDSKILEKIRKEISSKGLMDYIEWRDVMIARSESHPELEGLTIDEASRKLGKDPLELTVEIIRDDKGKTTAILFMMCEEDVEKVISHPYTSIGSDGYIVKRGVGNLIQGSTELSQGS